MQDDKAEASCDMVDVNSYTSQLLGLNRLTMLYMIIATSSVIFVSSYYRVSSHTTKAFHGGPFASAVNL